MRVTTIISTCDNELNEARQLFSYSNEEGRRIFIVTIKKCKQYEKKGIANPKEIFM